MLTAVPPRSSRGTSTRLNMNALNQVVSKGSRLVLGKGTFFFLVLKFYDGVKFKLGVSILFRSFGMLTGRRA